MAVRDEGTRLDSVVTDRFVLGSDPEHLSKRIFPSRYYHTGEVRGALLRRDGCHGRSELRVQQRIGIIHRQYFTIAR